MKEAFLSSPLWRKFHSEPLTVYRLSDGEHRLRDAHANILLNEFLPATSHLETMRVGGSGPRNVPKTGGLLILGRASLFPRRIGSIVAECQPRPVYDFASDDETDTSAYRSIVRRGLPKARKRRSDKLDGTLATHSFKHQRAAKKSKLTDNAIVYSGWRGTQPVMLLAGSSTVGTWAATHFVTKPPSPDLSGIWGQDIQAVIRGEVWAEEEAFDEVESSHLELLSPCRFWMEGGSLPPVHGWTRDVLQLDRPGGPEGLDLTILANGTPIAQKAGSYLTALVLLSWLAHGTPHPAGGFPAKVTSGVVLRTLFRFLQISKSNPIDLGERESGSLKRRPVSTMREFSDSKIGRHMNEKLKELTVAIRGAGGLAYAEENPRAAGNEARWTFHLASRTLPHFFPKLR